jgi:hypothetical protein
MRHLALALLVVAACGEPSAEVFTTADDAAAAHDAGAVDGSIQGPDAMPDAPTDSSEASSDASVDSSPDAGETDSGIDCDGDHYASACTDAGSFKSAWGVDARCTNPFRYRPFIQHRLNGIQGCDAATTNGGFAILCCPDGG